MSFRQYSQYRLHCAANHTTSTAADCGDGSFLLQAVHKEVRCFTDLFTIH